MKTIKQGLQYLRALAVKPNLPCHMESHMTCLCLLHRKDSRKLRSLSLSLPPFFFCQTTTSIGTGTLVLSETHHSAPISDKRWVVFGCLEQYPEGAVFFTLITEKRIRQTMYDFMTVDSDIYSYLFLTSFFFLVTLMTTNQFYNFILT